MTQYLVHPREGIFIIGYGFFFCKSIGNNISKNLSGKYSQKLLDHAKQSATNALKTTSKIGIKKKSRNKWWFF